MEVTRVVNKPCAEAWSFDVSDFVHPATASDELSKITAVLKKKQTSKLLTPAALPPLPQLTSWPGLQREGSNPIVSAIRPDDSLLTHLIMASHLPRDVALICCLTKLLSLCGTQRLWQFVALHKEVTVDDKADTAHRHHHYCFGAYLELTPLISPVRKLYTVPVCRRWLDAHQAVGETVDSKACQVAALSDDILAIDQMTVAQGKAVSAEQMTELLLCAVENDHVHTFKYLVSRDLDAVIAARQAGFARLSRLLVSRRRCFRFANDNGLLPLFEVDGSVNSLTASIRGIREVEDLYIVDTLLTKRATDCDLNSATVLFISICANDTLDPIMRRHLFRAVKRLGVKLSSPDRRMDAPPSLNLFHGCFLCEYPQFATEAEAHALDDKEATCMFPVKWIELLDRLRTSQCRGDDRVHGLRWLVSHPKFEHHAVDEVGDSLLHAIVKSFERDVPAALGDKKRAMFHISMLSILSSFIRECVETSSVFRSFLRSKDGAGKTPIEVAVELENRRLVSLLRQLDDAR